MKVVSPEASEVFLNAGIVAATAGAFKELLRMADLEAEEDDQAALPLLPFLPLAAVRTAGGASIRRLSKPRTCWQAEDVLARRSSVGTDPRLPRCAPTLARWTTAHHEVGAQDAPP